MIFISDRLPVLLLLVRFLFILKKQSIVKNILYLTKNSKCQILNKNKKAGEKLYNTLGIAKSQM